ncbi:hypothetical protein Rhe02_01530 [Rhizocola hellebori]|uniref:DUF4394 domain-containing protein n=1 Tax=Rhizocola hellebori TaxID=1392758 RepID=A0A8J3Q1V7_9ACTN|nr:DUF4394 domain-containing protein [Rhizocola hellebori]GIH02086.1 hypothetical protein Rhe02_01530 [Rhizocola hellebori]
MIHLVMTNRFTGGNMKLRPTHLLALTAAASIGLATPAIAYGAPGETETPVTTEAPVRLGIGLTTAQHLVTFKVNDPWTAEDIGEISGLVGDEDIVGIDYRVQDGLLYGLGNAGGVYTFEGVVGTKVSQLSVALTGAFWGVDFNPVDGLLRVVSDNGQNLIHDLETADADPLTDGNTVEEAALEASAIAYENIDSDATTGTRLLDIDTDLNQTSHQSTDTEGVLTLVGPLGIDVQDNAGFDIYSTLDANGAAASNKGVAALSYAGVFGLYDIDLVTGAAKAICDFPDELQVTDLAVQLS